MVIHKILERLRGSREPISPEHSQAQVSFEQAQAEYEAAYREMKEVQRKDEAVGRGLTQNWIAASQHAHALRRRLIQAKADFVQAGGSPDTVELTELVTRKVKQWFPADEQGEAIRLLETECGRNLPFLEAYDAEAPQEVRLLEDVRLAVVKLSGGSLAELRQQIEEAKLDIRDVVLVAHAPEQVKRGIFISADVDAETWREITARDRQQYEEWLRGHGPSDPPAA